MKEAAKRGGLTAALRESLAPGGRSGPLCAGPICRLELGELALCIASVSFGFLLGRWVDTWHTLRTRGLVAIQPLWHVERSESPTHGRVPQSSFTEL